jgi:hypothetical protein
VRHTSHFPRIFGRISIQLKNRFDPGKEFFNRIGQLRSQGTSRSAGNTEHWRSHAPRDRQERKNALERTAANCAGWILVTRYGSTENACSRRNLAAGNLAGKFDQRLANSLNLFRKPL